jgi:DNA-binding transcriptional LysR family regulator
VFDHRDLPLLVTFARVCREGSITAAARTLGLSKSVVSTQLKALETALGARLLHRTTRSLTPTQLGVDILALSERVAAATDEALALVEAQRGTASGTLRVASTHDLGARFVAPAVARLCAAHPELRAEILLDDAIVDPIAHRLDAMVRLWVPSDSSLVAKRLAEDADVVVAAPALAARWREADEPRALAGAPWVSHASFVQTKRHRFRRADGATQELAVTPPRVVANTTAALRALIVGGLGLGMLPRHLLADDLAAGLVERLIPAWRGRTIGVYLLHASGRHPARRVTLFGEELQRTLAAEGLSLRRAPRG